MTFRFKGFSVGFLALAEWEIFLPVGGSRTACTRSDRADSVLWLVSLCTLLYVVRWRWAVDTGRASLGN
jgi:hypothetical protein